MSLAIIGATSKIGLSIAAEFALDGHKILLVSRDTKGISRVDIAESALVTRLDADISNVGDIDTIVEEIIGSFDDDPYVLISAGKLGARNVDSQSRSEIFETIDVNFRNVAGALVEIAEELKRVRRGCIILLSSVAGDRGRQSNFVYGSAKAGLTVFGDGLRNSLYSEGVHVLTVKLGYVDTPMFRKAIGASSEKVPKFLVSNPEGAAGRIYKAALQRKNVVYVGKIWRLIMLVVCGIPEFIFKRLHL